MAPSLNKRSYADLYDALESNPMSYKRSQMAYVPTDPRDSWAAMQRMQNQLMDNFQRSPPSVAKRAMLVDPIQLVTRGGDTRHYSMAEFRNFLNGYNDGMDWMNGENSFAKNSIVVPGKN